MLVMIDNYDSFTYNLVQYFGDLKLDCKVVRNDACSIDDIIAINPQGIIISPGPGNPDQSNLSLESVGVAASHKIPLLGVCLGHQCIGQSFGGKVIRAPEPLHGKTSQITHIKDGLFKDIPSPYTVTRYHSLIVERESLPAELSITAQTDDGLIMGLSHKTLPIHGIQFHPESIATEHGHKLLENFTRIL
ncbi:MAG: aminodeoxychorismate/anthranilate synthase component II [Micavibrio sp.]|nr:aminodeoxychorismate/anthranilate synthase component II [Micavibrio sp.]|tara:strand:- start:302 stop:871 length:570 start_codon:yes stop_codon:yes gene_type:complete